LNISYDGAAESDESACEELWGIIMIIKLALLQ